MHLTNPNELNSAVNGVTDKVKSTIESTVDKAGNAAELIQQRVGQFASDVEDRAYRVAGAVANATSNAKSAVSQAVTDAGQKADQLTSHAGAGIQHLANNLGQRAPQTGVAGTAVKAVADSVRETGKYLEEAKLSGAADDAVALVRRYPVPAMLLAVGLGWYLARNSRKG